MRTLAKILCNVIYVTYVIYVPGEGISGEGTIRGEAFDCFFEDSVLDRTGNCAIFSRQTMKSGSLCWQDDQWNAGDHLGLTSDAFLADILDS